MTLLFFLRSPAGITDTGPPPSTGVYYDHEDARPKRKARKSREEKELDRFKKQTLHEAFEEANRIAVRKEKKRKKRKEEELLLMLMMHEFDGYDD